MKASRFMEEQIIGILREQEAALAGAMTDKRLALLRHLRRRGAASVADLARRLKRDYKRVHQDVEALEAAGLIARDGRGLRADYDEIRTVIAL